MKLPLNQDQAQLSSSICLEITAKKDQCVKILQTKTMFFSTSGMSKHMKYTGKNFL